MHKAADAADDTSQDLVALLYKELKQERAARAELQQQLWQSNAVNHQAAIPASHIRHGSISVCPTAPAAAAAAATALQSATLAPTIHQAAPAAEAWPSFRTQTAAHLPTATAATSSTRRQLLQQLQQAATSDDWPHANAAHKPQEPHQQMHHATQQQHHAHRRHVQIPSTAEPQLPHEQQQQQLQHETQQHAATAQQRDPFTTANHFETAAAPGLPCLASAAAAAADTHGSPAAFLLQHQQQPEHPYDFPYLPPRVQTPHIPPTGPAIATTPLTYLGNSSSQPCWSTPASCFSTLSSSSAHTPSSTQSRALAGSTAAAAAAVLSPEAAAVLSGAAAVRDRNSLQLLLESVQSSSSDSEPEPEHTSNLSSTGQQHRHRGCLEPTAHGLHMTSNQQMTHSIEQNTGHQQRWQQQQHVRAEVLFGQHTVDTATNVTAAVDGPQHAHIGSQIETQLQERNWDREIETFCSMLGGLDCSQEASSRNIADSTRLGPQLKHQLVEHDTIHAGQWLSLLQEHPPSRWINNNTQPPYDSTLGQSNRYAVQLEQQQAVAMDDMDTSLVLTDEASGAARQTVGCTTCKRLQERLLESEFERELTAAQLAVVVEERDVLALQHQSLLDMWVEKQER